MPCQHKHSDVCKTILKDIHKGVGLGFTKLTTFTTFPKILDGRKVDELISNPAVVCWPRGTLCLGIAWNW